MCEMVIHVYLEDKNVCRMHTAVLSFHGHVSTATILEGRFLGLSRSLERQVAKGVLSSICAYDPYFIGGSMAINRLVKVQHPDFAWAGSLGSQDPGFQPSTGYNPSIHSLCNTDPSNSVVPFKLDHSIFHILSRSNNSKLQDGYGSTTYFHYHITWGITE